MQNNVLNSMPTTQDAAATELSLSPASVARISATTPLNAWSRSPEAIGQALSNWAHLPFVLDGVEYASVEGLYASLLQLDPEKRATFRTYWGIKAKRAIPKRRLNTIYYDGCLIAYPSDEFFAILARGIRAKFIQHPTIARAFVETRPRPIIHDTGYPRKAECTSRSHDWLCATLSEIREELFRTMDTVGSQVR